MHEMTIYSEDLRDALKVFLPFATYERDKRLNNLNFNAPLWEDKVRFDVLSDDLMVRLTYDADHYHLTTNIHCDSNDDVRFYLNINDLLDILKDIEDEDILMQEFYSSTSVRSIMEDLREMKATSGHNNFGYHFMIDGSEKSLGRLQAFFARNPYTTLCSRADTNPIGKYVDFSGEILAATLYDFADSTRSFCELDQQLSFIWYTIRDNCCIVRATDNHFIKAKDYSLSNELQNGGFGILGELAELIASLINKKPVTITYGHHHCTLMVDGVFIEMAYNYVEKRPPFDSILDKFSPQFRIILKKDKLEQFISTAENQLENPYFIDFHSSGRYTYVLCFDGDNETKYVGDIFKNMARVEEFRFRLQLYMLKWLLSNNSTLYVAISIDPNQKGVFNISDVCSPFSKKDAQLLAGAYCSIAPEMLDKIERELLVEKGTDESFYDDDNTKVESFVIGEKFTRHPINIDGSDRLVPVITSQGIDVVLALSNISTGELSAITKDPIYLGVFEMNAVPYIVVNFNGILLQQFALNVMTMDDMSRIEWLYFANRDLMRIFLVDSIDGKLISVRMHSPRLMDHIKTICKKQSNYNPYRLSNDIIQTESVMSVQEMFQYAQEKETLEIEFIDGECDE